MSDGHLYALIMAGGSGTRLWPRSRGAHPKQFLDLISPSTMLQEARNRLEPLIPSERILIATNASYTDTVAAQVPDIPRANILGEPEGRGTAAAIGLAAAHLHRRSPDAVMAVLTADHLITRPAEFRAALDAAAEVASDDWLVTLGIQPSYPETGYGYIQRGQAITAGAPRPAYRVVGFTEKPPRAEAEQYLLGGLHSWNSGMFIWRARRILAEMEHQLPDLAAGLKEIEASIGGPDAESTLQRVWPTLPRTTIDYGIMEHADRVAVIPVDIGWNDVGSWASVYDVLAKDERGNVVVGEHLTTDTTGSLIYSPHRLVATAGLKDLVIIDTGDALLILPRERSQDVKDLVAQLQQARRSELL